MAKPRVGFIGLGNMGWPMAANLARAGFAVGGFDIGAGRAKAFADEIGATAHDDLVSLARASDIIITILPTSREVSDVITTMLPALSKGQLVIEMSSGAPEVTRTLGQSLAERGVGMVDAPVSGGVSRATDGTLSIIAGGDDAHMANAKAVFDAVSSSVTHVGSLGAGQAVKALNNMVSAVGFIAGIEALLVGQRFGVDPARIVDVLNASTGMSNSSQKKFKQFVLSRQFNSGFGLDLMLKDLGIACDLARQTGTPTPISAQTRELASAAVAMLGRGRDHTEFARVIEMLAGQDLGSSSKEPSTYPKPSIPFDRYRTSLQARHGQPHMTRLEETIRSGLRHTSIGMRLACAHD